MNKNVSKNLENTQKQIQSTLHSFNTWPIGDNCNYYFSIFEKANLEYQAGRKLKTLKALSHQIQLYRTSGKVTEIHPRNYIRRKAIRKLYKKKSDSEIKKLVEAVTFIPGKSLKGTNSYPTTRDVSSFSKRPQGNG